MISIRSNKVRWGLSAVLALLILFGTYRNVFSLAAFLICGLMLVFCDRETNILQMFFIMPLANIFKLSPSVQSFFTIILLVYVVLHLVLPRKATMLVVLFAVYVLIGQLFAGEVNLFRSIKLICNFLFLSSILNGKVDIRYKEIFWSYIIGNIVSSVFGLMDSPFFKIESYIGVQSFGNPDSGDLVYRFTGLYADPNYYAVGLIISLCLMIVLYHRNEGNPFVFALMAAVIFYFLIKTYSKSAVIMLLLPLGLLLYSFIRHKKYILAVSLIVLVVTVVILALSGYIEAFEIVLERLYASESSDGVDVNVLTTGRLDLWIIYIKYLINNFAVGFFGRGISSNFINDRAAHNTYLDVFYFLGAVGGTLLAMLLAAISAQSRRMRIKRNIMNYSVVLCVVIMYFFLSELFYFDPPFHIFLALTVLNLPDKGNRSDEMETRMVTDNEYV